LDAHFFRRLPKKIPAKNNFWGWQSSKKIERTIEDNQPNGFLNLEFWAFYFSIDKKNTLFFFN
jgi:hypothetical protein